MIKAKNEHKHWSKDVQEKCCPKYFTRPSHEVHFIVIWSLQLYWKKTPLQVFLCDFRKISQNSFTVEHLSTTASKGIACTSKAD